MLIHFKREVSEPVVENHLALSRIQLLPPVLHRRRTARLAEVNARGNQRAEEIKAQEAAQVLCLLSGATKYQEGQVSLSVNKEGQGSGTQNQQTQGPKVKVTWRRVKRAHAVSG